MIYRYLDTMPKLLQINVTANWGSTGKIAEDIGKTAVANGWESYIAYGRDTQPTSLSHLIRIGNKWDMYYHGLQTRLFDRHGLASKRATRDFIEIVKRINPDVIHIHNIHGYYINYEILFEYLSIANKPIVWTLHDCWPFTGHCAYFDMANCEQWKTGCDTCEHQYVYPTANLCSNSAKNYRKKIDAFTSVKNMMFVPVSDWLLGFLGESFLNKYPRMTIHNGIDTNIFAPIRVEKKRNNRFLIIGVASVWAERKGMKDFVELRKLLPTEYDITLIGLNKEQIDSLPLGINGISRTNSLSELVEYYAVADIYVNPTYEDNFPTTNLEALACGTPVITYDTGGSPEAIDETTGIVVPQGDVKALAEAILKLRREPLSSEACRKRAEVYFDKDKCFKQYIDLYNELISSQ